MGFTAQKIRAPKGSPPWGKEAFRPAQGHFYAIVPFQRCIKAAKEGGFLMVPREQSGNIGPNFITESSETLEECFPLIIINSRKKSFTPKAGSICPAVFSHLHFKQRGCAPAQRGDPIPAPLAHGHSEEIQTGRRLTSLLCTLNKQAASAPPGEPQEDVLSSPCPKHTRSSCAQPSEVPGKARSCWDVTGHRRVAVGVLLSDPRTCGQTPPA